MPNTLSPVPEPAAPATCQQPLASDCSLLLDAERLDVYRVAVEFQKLADQLLPRRGQGALRDQLDRASVSIVLNIAEGAGRFSPADKARFYVMARGSASECAAILNLLSCRGLAPASACRRSRGLLVRIIQMLTKLNARLQK